MVVRLCVGVLRIGVLVCRVLVCWYVLVRWRVCVLVCWCLGGVCKQLVCWRRCVGVLLMCNSWCVLGVLVCGALACWCVAVLVLWPAGGLVWCPVSVLVAALVCWSGDDLLCWCARVCVGTMCSVSMIGALCYCCACGVYSHDGIVYIYADQHPNRRRVDCVDIMRVFRSDAHTLTHSHRCCAG